MEPSVLVLAIIMGQSVVTGQCDYRIADGWPAPDDQNRRCGHCCGADDTESPLCQGTSNDGRLYLLLSEMKARCDADQLCVGFGATDNYFRPVRFIDGLGGPDGWQTYTKTNLTNATQPIYT